MVEYLLLISTVQYQCVAEDDGIHTKYCDVPYSDSKKQSEEALDGSIRDGGVQLRGGGRRRRRRRWYLTYTCACICGY